MGFGEITMCPRMLVLMAFLLCPLRQAFSKQESSATLILGGDVSLSGPVKYFASKNRGCDYEKPFDKVRHLFHGADLTLVNLESPILKEDPKKYRFVMRKKLSFAAEEKALQGLRNAGVTVVSVANNHFLDFGPSSANLTIQSLSKYGIKVIGVGFGTKQLGKQVPLVRTINGIKIGFLAYCYVASGCLNLVGLTKVGPAVFSMESARKDIQSLVIEDAVDHVVVFMHWGMEFISIPPLFIKNLAKNIVMLGANIVVGCHPHVSQVHELKHLYDAPLVIEYSLGNLLFPPHTSDPAPMRPWGLGKDADSAKFIKSTANSWDTTRYGKLLKLVLSKEKIEKASYLPFEIKFNRENNCMQPTPSSNTWIDVCSPQDVLQCPNLSFVFSDTTKDEFD